MLIDSMFAGRLISLYGLIFLGFIAGKNLSIQKESIASILIYIIAPVVVFNGVIHTNLSLSTLSLPLLFFVIGTLLCLFFYFIGSLFWKTSERNILAFAAGAGNTGYFGIPLVISLFGESYLGIAVLLTLGVILYENSLGFFITAKGNYRTKDALIKLCKLPTLYAFFAGILVQMYSIVVPLWLNDVFSYFRGTYTILGMMLVGLGIAGITRVVLDSRFTVMALLAKFVCWPILAIASIAIDRYFFHLWTPEIYHVILILSIVPLASNTVAFAIQFNTYPEKSAITVLFSTFFAVVYIPVFIYLILPLLRL